MDQILAARVDVGVGDVVEVISPRQRLTPMGLLPVRLRFEVTQVRAAEPGSESRVRFGCRWTRRRRLLWGRAGRRDHRAARPSRPLASRRPGPPGRSVTGPPSLRVEGLDELHRPLLVALALERVMIFVAVGLMLVVAALNLLCNVAMVAAEKRTDLAVLAGLGMPPSSLRRLFLLIGLGIGAVRRR